MIDYRNILRLHSLELHMAVFPGRQGRNNRPVRAVIGGQQAS